MNTSYLIAIIVLVMMSAYFSATETSFSSLNRMKLRTLIENKDKHAKKAEATLKLVEEYDKLISTILIGNNIVNIAVASLGTVFFMEIDEVNGATISTIVITILVLVFGEISPKSLAKDCPEKFAMFATPVIKFLMYVFTPLNFLFSQWKKLLSVLFKVKEDSGISPEELMLIVDEVEKVGNLDEDESELIRNAIEFSDNTAENILTHRVDVEAVSINASNEEIMDTFNKTQYSRLLVYKDSIDNIVGVIHMKDYFTINHDLRLDINSVMTKPVYIQKTEKINNILKILQKNKAQIAVVIDECGGTQGIVTMEDILEELVGEIWDEHDDIVEFIKEVGDNTYEVDAGMDINDFSKFFDIDCESDSTLVSGWVMETLGKIPEEKDSFTYDNLIVEITKTDSHRVLSIKVIEKQKAED